MTFTIYIYIYIMGPQIQSVVKIVINDWNLDENHLVGDHNCSIVDLQCPICFFTNDRLVGDMMFGFTVSVSDTTHTVYN